MRSDWLAGAVAMVVLLGATPDARGQVRPRPGTSTAGVRSLFGNRSLGWPVWPKARDFGGGGAFGPRPNFRRGFRASTPFSLTEGPGPEPAYPSQGNLELNRITGQPYEAAPQLQPELAVAQTGEVAGQAAEAGTQPEGGVGTAGENPASVGTGEAGSGAEGTAVGARPSFQWGIDSLRGLPAEALLAERLRRILQHRLRSPVDVSIRNQTAVLRGVVATEHDRTLAGHLARFEPGVRQVNNELTVAASSTGRPSEHRAPDDSPD